MEVTANGPHITIEVNVVTTADGAKTDATSLRSGTITLQRREGEPAGAWFTGLRIKSLP